MNNFCMIRRYEMGEVHVRNLSDGRVWGAGYVAKDTEQLAYVVDIGLDSQPSILDEESRNARLIDSGYQAYAREEGYYDSLDV